MIIFLELCQGHSLAKIRQGAILRFSLGFLSVKVWIQRFASFAFLSGKQRRTYWSVGLSASKGLKSRLAVVSTVCTLVRLWKGEKLALRGVPINCRCSSVVEQLICNQLVGGSSPFAGSWF